MLHPLLALVPLALAQDAPAGAELVPRGWIAIEAVDARGRRPFPRDAVFARHLLAPDAPPPAAGDELSGELGEARAWRPLEVDAAGAFAAPFGWAYCRLEVSEAQAGVWLADLQAARTLYVNGAPFVGDYYAAYGARGVPVELRPGANQLYVTGTRGRPRLVLRRPPAPLFVADWSTTAPELTPGATGEVLLAALVVNASVAPLLDVGVELRVPTTGEWHTPGAPFPLPPLGIAKPALSFRAAAADAPLGLRLEPRAAGVAPGAAGALELALGPAPVGAGDVRRVTFRSGVDGSVQEYALRAATGARADAPPGLVLSLHGAGVASDRQAGSYAALPDLWIVAPTNRRPFGFDWQDWGRADAYEVLGDALERSGADPRRVFLTGHSMGGHGAWHLAANDPDRWAAVAPSAGWESFDAYGGRPADALADVWQDADGASRTLALVENLAQLPLFVLHGEADDNVPVDQARTMLAALEAAGASPGRHLQPGAGHWWDGDAAPGVDCLTWPGILELFRAARRPRDPEQLAFVTVDPAQDSAHHWVAVLQQESYGRPSRVAARRVGDARVVVETYNVRTLAVTPPAAWAARELVVDGVHLGPPQGAAALDARAGGGWLVVRERGAWRPADGPAPGEKSPARGGPLKRAFAREFALVYGTQGNPGETRALLERARHDAQTWWYRANGTTLVLTDAQALDAAFAERLRDRDVILYGNADTNAAWGALVPERCPVRATRGALRIGEATHRGDDLACAFVYPRRGSDRALVGVFADTGLRGTRLGFSFQTFISGAGFPDLAAVSSAVLTEGDAGVLAAGFFDARWELAGLRYAAAR